MSARHARRQPSDAVIINEIRETFRKYGQDGLASRERGRSRMPNQRPPELEARILEMTEQFPV